MVFCSRVEVNGERIRARCNGLLQLQNAHVARRHHFCRNVLLLRQSVYGDLVHSKPCQLMSAVGAAHPGRPLIFSVFYRALRIKLRCTRCDTASRPICLSVSLRGFQTLLGHKNLLTMSQAESVRRETGAFTGGRTPRPIRNEP